MKKLFGVLCLFALLLSGCAGPEEQSRNTLSIWGLQEHLPSGLEDAAAAYNTANGEGLTISLRSFPDEEALAEAFNLARPDLLFCSYRRAEELQERGHLRSLGEQLTVLPAYGGGLDQRLPLAGDCFFPLGTVVQLLCARENGISPEELSDPEKLCDAALRYRRAEAVPAFTADDFSAFFLHAMLSVEEEFHARLSRDKNNDRFKYIYNLLTETALDGALLSTEYRAVDLLESDALPLALADSRSLAGFSGPVAPAPAYRSSLRYPGDTLGFAVTAERGRDMAPIARFLDQLHTGGRSCSLALRSGLVPALPGEQEEDLRPAAACLLELGLYYEIYLPDKSSDYIKNRPEFEAAFRKTLERLY